MAKYFALSAIVWLGTATLAVAAAPTVTSFTPTGAPAGFSVTVSGTAFDPNAANDIVYFNSYIRATVQSASATQLIVTVPAGATTGPITLLVDGKSLVASASSFTVYPIPSITSFAPASGSPGASVTINGFFDSAATAATTHVTFNGWDATVISASPTAVIAAVPTGATTGPIKVYYDKGLGTTSTGAISPANFTVIPASGPTLSGFSPGQGPVGTLVTLTGANFDPNPANDTVTFNGALASVSAATATSLTVLVPADATSGPITVSVAGANTASSSSFIVMPALIGFTPQSGSVGSVVTITGSSFDPNPANDTVTFNGAVANVTAASAGSLTVTVPAGASTGPIGVTVGNQTAISSSVFSVGSNAGISGFSPNRGPPGTVVTITGIFDAATTAANTSVSFNGVAATVTTASSTSITVVVPTSAITGPISVYLDNGTALTSQTNFTVATAVAPIVTSFLPLQGPIGTKVTIAGANFDPNAANDVVTFNGVQASVTAASATSLTAIVPAGATSGPISVTAGGLTGTSNASFVVTPGIVSFSPTGGVPGTVVTITGTSFDPNKLNDLVAFTGPADSYGNPTAPIPANVISATSTQLTVTVPAGFAAGPITVTVAGFSVVSTQSFGTFGISGIDPTVGSAGTVVTISGTGFDAVAGNNSVTFNGVTVPASSISTAADGTQQLQAVVPADAPAGSAAISVTANNSTVSSTDYFSIQPTVSAISPQTVTGGTTVTITGSNFGQDVSLALGDTQVAITADSDTTLTFVVPKDLPAGNIRLVVTSGNQATQTGLLVVPTITTLTPASGAANSTMQISGTNFGLDPQDNTVLIGDAPASVTSVTSTDSGTTLEVLVTSIVPQGINPVTVTVGGQTATSPVDFTMQVAPIIATFSPLQGTAGTQVTINGMYFSATAADNTVTFNGTPAPQILSASTTSLTVIAPSGVTTGAISVTVAGLTGTSVAVFDVLLKAPTPSITGITPSTGSVQSSVVITGSNFSATAGDDFVIFSGGGPAAAVTQASTTQLTVTVPTGAATGPFSVTVNGQTATGPVFTVQAPTPPTISGFTPTAGTAGTTVVTINGTNFDPIAANDAVKFNGVPAALQSATSTQIVATVPAGASTGPISVTVGGLSAVSTSPFTVQTPPPTISGFNPDNGSAGVTSVTIFGTHFDPNPANDAVFFNGTQAAVQSASADGTQVVALVPPGATTGPISVTVAGTTATSADSFTVHPPLTVTDFSPTSGPAGSTTVTITGTNFNPSAGANTVAFTGGTATVQSASADGTRLTVKVPGAARTGPITVTANGANVQTRVPFLVTNNNFPSPAACAAASTPMFDPGSDPGLPGLWANPNRGGTAWSINFNIDHSIAVTWFTYDGEGNPIWLSNQSAAAVANSGNEEFLVPLYRPTLGSDGSVTFPPAAEAQVKIAFAPGTNTTAAIRWTWSAVGPAAQPDECIYDIYGAGAPQPFAATDANTQSIRGPVRTASATGKWASNFNPLQGITSAATGTGSYDADPYLDPSFTEMSFPSGAQGGLSTTIGVCPQNANSCTPGDLLETDITMVFDTQGNTAWLMGSVVDPVADFMSVQLAYKLSNYPGNYPASDCTDNCTTSDIDSNNTYTRAQFLCPSPAPPDAICENFTLNIDSGPHSPRQPIINVHPPRPGFPRNTEKNFISVSQSICSSACTVLVGWTSTGNACIYERDLTSNVLAFFGGGSGNEQVSLNAGADVQFELHQGCDQAGAGTLLFTSSEVRVLGTPSSSGPRIISFTPTSGPAGTTLVTVFGANFDPDPTQDQIVFDNYYFRAQTASSDGSQLTFTVPSGATTSPISITVGGVTVNSLPFMVLTASSPSITSFTPTQGPAGTTQVTIIGINFDPDATQDGVAFFGTPATVISAKSDGTQLVVTVPANAASGVISVTARGQTVYSSTPFQVTAAAPGPSISSFTPTQGPAGTTQVIIYGANFDANSLNDAVAFNGAAATIQSVVSTGEIHVTVPANATTGQITVTVNGQKAYSPLPFTVGDPTGPVVPPPGSGLADPGSPSLATAPATDTDSDDVGATTGQFSVDQGGNSSYSIPIYTPHGAGGLTPGLALSYNSGDGEGVLGMGWQLQGESAISVCRKTQEHGDGAGVNELAHFDPPNAVYCLDGGRLDLVSGSNGQQGATYRLESDSFSRVIIEKADTAGAGYTVPTTWAVYNKDGTVHRYGGTDMDGSIHRNQLAWIRATDQAQFTKSWYRYEIRDSNNLAIAFNYAHYQSIFNPNVAILPSLVSVTYAGGSIAFNNGFCAENESTNYQAGVPVRRNTLIGGTVIAGDGSQSACLSAADGKSATTDSITVSSNGTVLRNYRLTYRAQVTNPGIIGLTQIQECDGSSPAVCYAPTVFNWADASAWNAVPTTRTRTSKGSPGEPPETVTVSIPAQDPGISVLNGNHEESFFYALPGSVRFGDINGDGRSDVVYLHDYGSGKHANFIIGTSDPSRGSNQGGGFSSLFDEDTAGGGNASTHCTSYSDAGTPTHNFTCPQQYKFLDYSSSYQLIDFNGDGKDDLLMLEPTSDFEDDPTQFRWVVWLSDGNKFATKVTGIVGCSTPPCDMPLTKDPGNGTSAHSHSGNLQVADMDGDGLPDVFVLNDTSATVWLLKPNTTNQPCPKADGSGTIGACPYLFQGPYNVVIDMPQGAAACPIGDFTSHQLRVSDFNGDGRADILLKQSHACAAPNNPPAANEYLQVFTAIGVGADHAYHFAPGYAFPHFQQCGINCGGNGYANSDLFQIGDINGDGLPDVAYAHTGDLSAEDDTSATWQYQLNTGDGGFTNAIDVAGGTVFPGPYEVQLGDYDGDGRADFIAPNWRTPSSCINLSVYLWRGDTSSNYSGFSVDPVCSPFESPDIGSKVKNLYSYLADMDGDGYPDQLMIDTTGDGQFNHGGWQITRTTAHHKPRNMITSIQSGLGATTELSYAPLTYDSVYFKEYDAQAMVSGYGAPVQDSISPRFVVQYAESSAPTEYDPQHPYTSGTLAMSTIRYQYAGQKIQGFGRGSLGFHKVYSTDAQTGISTVTTYNQPFPYTGTPFETVAYQGGTAVDTTCDPDAGGNPDSPTCMSYGSQGDGLGGTPLSDTLDGYAGYWQDSAAGSNSPHTTPAVSNNSLSAALSSSGPTPIFLARTASSQVKYGLDGYLLSAQRSSFDYTSGAHGVLYGELYKTLVTDYADDNFASKVRTSTTLQAYDANKVDATHWWISRLSQSTTTVQGNNSDGLDGETITRSSTFGYDGGTGQLNEEHLQQGEGNTLEVNKYHFHDSYGNETEVDTCSHTAGCSTTTPLSAAPQNMKFTGDSDPTWVQRYARSDFSDTNGVYANKAYAPFSNGSGGATEVMTLQVLSRDAFGTPTDSRDAHGVETTAATNTLGRTYFAASNTGAAAKTIYRWCNGHAPAGTSSQTVSCPAGVVYRVETNSAIDSTSNRSPTTWAYYDVLARAVLKVQQGFDKSQFVALTTSYDNLGRTSKTTEPYFTSNPTQGGFTGASTDGSLSAKAACLYAPYCSVTSYDILGRATKIVHPNGSITTTDYNQLSVTITLPANGSGEVETRSKEQNHLGQVVTVTDTYGSTLTNAYDPSGNVLSVTRHGIHGATATSTMTYDVLGRKTSLTDPDAGTWSYQYNALGEQVAKVNSGKTPTCTRSFYDGQGRATTRSDYASANCSGAATTATWIYDANLPSGAGLLALSSNNDNGLTESQTPTYDGFGRVSTVTTAINAMHYFQRSFYDKYGRAFQSTFAGDGIDESGELVGYNAQGYADEVRDAEGNLTGTLYEAVTSMDARGHVTAENHANGNLDTTRKYDTAMGWLTKINSAQSPQLSGSPATIQNLVYQYDALGNMVQRNDTSPNSGTNEYACYDALQRLVWQGNTANATPPCSATAKTPTPLPTSIRATADDRTTTGVGARFIAPGSANAPAIAPDNRMALYPLPLMANAAASLPNGVSTQNDYDDFGNIHSNGQIGYVYQTYANNVCGNDPSNYPDEVSQAGPDAVTQANGATYCYDSHGNQTRAIDSTTSTVTRSATYTAYDALRIAAANNHTTVWSYGIGRERLVREDYSADLDTNGLKSSAPSSVTHYIGNAEIHLTGGVATEVKRYLNGLILTQTITSGTAAISYDYLFTDNLGSTHRIADENGTQLGPNGAQAYTAFGSRASANNGVMAALNAGAEFSFDASLTHHGFTGHEMMDETGLIHMNGRVYDPALGRFVQADPFVQDAGNLQSLNRYSYVMNNPLATSDPTGYWGHRQQGYLRTVAAIVITVVTYGAASGEAAAADAAEEAAIDASQVTAIANSAEAAEFATVVAGGAAAGYVQTGNLKGAVLGGIEAGADFGIGQNLPTDGNWTSAQDFENYGAHAAVGGVMAVLQGGKFGHGFVTAGLQAAIDPHLNTKDAVVGTIQAAITGGTLSRLTGGKFANGALSSAFEFAFNEELSDKKDEKEGMGSFLLGIVKAVRDAITPIANGLVDPYGERIDPSTDRIGPGPGHVEQGGYKFGSTLVLAAGARGIGSAPAGLVESEVALTTDEPLIFYHYTQAKLPVGAGLSAGSGVTSIGDLTATEAMFKLGISPPTRVYPVTLQDALDHLTIDLGIPARGEIPSWQVVKSTPPGSVGTPKPVSP